MPKEKISNERWLVLITMMVGTFMAALDGSIVNISLPPMAKQFGSTMLQIEWVVVAYMIAFAVSIPLTNWLKDTLGFRWLYMISLAVFTLGSAACGLAITLDQLIVARVIQALGGGALAPTAMAIISTIFLPRERGRAIGIWGLGVVLGPAIGPTLGGVLTEHFGWPSIFWINVPVGIMGIALSAKVLHRADLNQRTPKRFDTLGFVLLSVFLVTMLMGVTGFEDGSSGTRVAILWATALVSFFGFLQSSLRNPHPIVDLKIFSNREFVACTLVSVARSAALFGGVFLLPFLLQSLLGYSETKSGLLMLPGALLVAVLMPFSGKWADAHGPRGISMVGILLLSISMGMFSLIPLHATVALILLTMSLRGIGLGLLVTPVSVATVNSVPKAQITLASSMGSLMQQIGGAAGVAVFALVHQVAYGQATGDGFSAYDAEAYALKISFTLIGALVLTSMLPAARLPREIKNHDEGLELMME